MFVNGTTTLCCGEFLRQELERTLVQHGCLAALDTADLFFSEDYIIASVEAVIVRTLSLWCDLETCAHAQRLVGLAEAVGVSMHLKKEDLIVLRLAALLHDIGKVAIPETILQKSGPLDSREWALMRLHPEMGQTILYHAGGLFAQIALLVVAHHEAWDGSGYPVGLIGKEIPLLARILAVVDSYDAMTSYRVYGKPLPVLQAYQELQRCAGHQYDPLVVHAFLYGFIRYPLGIGMQKEEILFRIPRGKACATMLSKIAQ